MKILFFATYREITKTKVLEMPIEGLSNIRQLIKKLIELFPEFQDELLADENHLKPLVHIFVNGRNIIHLNGIDTLIKQDDEIALIPPVGGG